MKDTNNAYRLVSLMATATMGLALTMIAMKFYLYYVTGAASFLAALLDSMMDLSLSGMMWLGIKWASKPADHNHRYGHGKMEALIGFVQFLVVSGAACLLAVQAGLRFAKPELLQPNTLDIVVSVIILITNVALVAAQTAVIRKTDSLAIQGDRAHYLSDMLGNCGLLVLLLLNKAIAVPWADPLLSLAIALALLASAMQVGKQSMNMLLDHEASEEFREELFVAASLVPLVEGVHDLRVIDGGMRLRVSLDIELDGGLTLDQAHDVAKHVESGLLALAPNAEIMIHMDPIGDREDSRHQNLKPHHFT